MLPSRPTLSERQLKNARKATSARAQERRLQSRYTGPSSDRVSTFPRQFEGLRDQLFERAKNTPAFLETVFSLHAPPTDDEIMQAVENRLFSLTQDYPAWFGQTPDADGKAHELKRDHDITHGFIKAAPLTESQKAALARRKQERLAREQRINERVMAGGAPHDHS